MRLVKITIYCIGFCLLAVAPPWSLSLKLQPVVMKAGDLSGLAGIPREQLALMVYLAGFWQPAPFQVDPCDGRGYVFGAKPMLGATPPGPVGPDDEIVFMASDAGDRATSPPGAGPVWEVTIEAQGVKRYVYLWAAPASPPRSKLDYVAYRREPNRERVTTPRYVQTFVPEEAFFSDLSVLPPDGDGRDIFDHLKMRSRVYTVAGISVGYNETEFRSRVNGLRDGPVRVIRQNMTSIDILLGLKTPEALVNEIFWRDSFEVPSELRLPYGVDMVINRFDYYQGCDLNRAAGPFIFHSDAGGPVTVDGKMSPAEQAMAQSPVDHHWGMVSGPAGNLFYISDWFDRESPAKIRLFYLDDATVDDGPESERGVSMYGIRLEDGIKLAGGGQRLNIIVYILPQATTVEETKWLLRPVSVKTKRLNTP